MQMEVHSENIAHSNMPGYKRLEAAGVDFSAMMDRAMSGQNEVQINHEQGALRVTDRTLDFAIEGDGFFVVSDGTREYLTRNGHFTLAPDGTAVNSMGMRLQTSSGDLQIPRKANVDNLAMDEKTQSAC